MNTWQYRAVDALGRRHRGRLRARHEAELESRLARGGLLLLRARAVRDRSFLVHGHTIPRRALLGFLTQLSQLVEAGIPLQDALVDMAGSSVDERQQRLAADLVNAIESGHPLSRALADGAGRVDPVCVAMIHVGEESGRLAESLADVTRLLQRREELAGRVREALAYPALVLAVLAAVVPFLMIWLVPQLTDFLRDIGGELPWQTILLIATSDFLGTWWWLLGLTALLVAVGTALLLRWQPGVQVALDHALLRGWLVGELLHELELARYTHALARMYAAGLPLHDALHLASGLMRNRALAGSASALCTAVHEGSTVSDAFARVGHFPPLVIRMVRVGELTGRMDEALLAASRFQAAAARQRLQRLETALQPALTVFLGLLVAWILLAMLGPVYHSLTVLDL